MDSPKLRLDKWMWSVRLYKTRSLAAEAADKGRIQIGELTVKPSRNIKPGEVIIIHRGAWHQHIRVLKPTENRLSAKLVPEFAEDITPDSELEKLQIFKAAQAAWHQGGGSGRPTKKDRRDINDYMDDW